jgi:hypothetical protein
MPQILSYLFPSALCDDKEFSLMSPSKTVVCLQRPPIPFEFHDRVGLLLLLLAAAVVVVAVAAVAAVAVAVVAEFGKLIGAGNEVRDDVFWWLRDTLDTADLSVSIAECNIRIFDVRKTLMCLSWKKI